MALEIYWSKRADKKFDEIIDYLLANWNEQVAQEFIKRVYDFLDILVDFPEIGTIERKKNVIRGFTIVKQISIFYIVDKNKIIILNFFGTRQDPLKKRF